MAKPGRNPVDKEQMEDLGDLTRNILRRPRTDASSAVNLGTGWYQTRYQEMNSAGQQSGGAGSSSEQQPVEADGAPEEIESTDAPAAAEPIEPPEPVQPVVSVHSAPVEGYHGRIIRVDEGSMGTMRFVPQAQLPALAAE